MEMYDIIIIGGGPAGLTAAAYSARAGMSTVLIERYPVTGGQMNLTDIVENFPGQEPAEGMEIAEKLRKQAADAGAKIINAEVSKIIDGKIKTVIEGKNEIGGRTIIYAAGTDHKKLGVKGEEEFIGRGVSYCAVCDGGFFRNKIVSVIGGGDTALKEALYLSRLCSKVYLIHRRDSFRGSRDKLLRCEQAENIEIIRSTICTEIMGDKKVESIKLKSGEKEYELPCSGVFAAVGSSPLTELLKDICELDENGYIIAGEDCVTSAAGIFAAGDVRQKKLRQIVTACADGASAVYSAEAYLSSLDI